MGEFVSHFFEFLWGVLVNWRNLIAAVVFVLFSFPNAALSGAARSNFDMRWPPDFRRKWLVRIAVGYVFFACFLAWNEQRTSVIELQNQQDSREQRREIAKKITAFVQEGNKIAKTFEDKNDKELIGRQYDDWNNRCDVMLNTGVGESYAAQFESAKGNGLLLMNHSIEGDEIYSLLQGKIAVLNSFLTEFRALPKAEGQ